MAILKYIDGYPLFSTVKEVLDFGKQYEIDEYHIHKFKIRPNVYRTGYMIGKTHADLKDLSTSSTPLPRVLEDYPTSSGSIGY